jgi:hypothetical protein
MPRAKQSYVKAPDETIPAVRVFRNFEITGGMFKEMKDEPERYLFYLPTAISNYLEKIGKGMPVTERETAQYVLARFFTIESIDEAVSFKEEFGDSKLGKELMDMYSVALPQAKKFHEDQMFYGKLEHERAEQFERRAKDAERKTENAEQKITVLAQEKTVLAQTAEAAVILLHKMGQTAPFIAENLHIDEEKVKSIIDKG